MKKSSAVVLAISGALLAGCDGDGFSGWGSSQTYTNNHYAAGRGYYHAPYYGWFPFPYNHYDSTRQGYFHGGKYTTQPHVSNVTSSQPTVRRSTSSSSHVRRSGFSSSRSGIS